jgi:hypothetical protein
MFIYKQPTEVGGERGKAWKIVYRVLPSELESNKPERGAPVLWIPNGISGYAIDYNVTPSGNEFLLSINAVENNYQL